MQKQTGVLEGEIQGTTLLNTMDNFALHAFNTSLGQITTNNTSKLQFELCSSAVNVRKIDEIA